MFFSQHIWMFFQLDIGGKYNSKESYIQSSELQILQSCWDLTTRIYIWYPNCTISTHLRVILFSQCISVLNIRISCKTQKLYCGKNMTFATLSTRHDIENKCNYVYHIVFTYYHVFKICSWYIHADYYSSPWYVLYC